MRFSHGIVSALTIFPKVFPFRNTVRFNFSPPTESKVNDERFGKTLAAFIALIFGMTSPIFRPAPPPPNGRQPEVRPEGIIDGVALSIQNAAVPRERIAAIPMSSSAIRGEPAPEPSKSMPEGYRAARRRQRQSQCRGPMRRVYRSSSRPPWNWFCILRLPGSRSQARDHAALNAANDRLNDIVAPRLFHPGLDPLGVEAGDNGTDRRTLFH